MKKFKKAMALSLALAMGLSVVACGESADSTTAAATEAEPALPKRITFSSRFELTAAS